MRSSPLRIVLFVAFVDLVGFGLIIPLQASYAERLGASGFVFGLLIGVYAAMQFLFNPILGRWSDRIGRRPVLLLSMSGSVVSHVLLGMADLTSSLPLLFLARTLDGVTGANIATAQAYVADVTTSENRARGMGLFGAAFGLGFVIGPAIGAGLATLGKHVSGSTLGSAWPAFGAAGIALVACVLVWRFLPEPRREATSVEARTRAFSFRKLRVALSRERYRELYTLVFFGNVAFVLLEVTFVYLCVQQLHVEEAGTGLLFAYFGVLMVCVQGGLVGRLVPRVGEMGLLCVAPFITAAGFAVISAVPWSTTLPMAWMLLLVGCLPTALGHGLMGPPLNGLISRQAPTGSQGETLGLSQGIGSLARALAPPIGGLLYEVGPQWPYWIGAALLIVMGVYARRIRPAQEAALLEAMHAKN